MTAEALGRYEIVEQLGRGAGGGVYLAQDPERGRLVALKVLEAAAAGGALRREAVLHEARTAGELDHPHIVAVLEARDGQRPFIVMEYVPGTDLEEVLRPGKPLPGDFAVHVAEQVAAALDYAHSRGVVHRDVKPANILITAEETVKLTDFGIAAAPTAAGPEHYGTAHYVAPEQLRGEPVDGRADVFGLGVVVYEMLTGKRPFAADSLEQVVRRVAEEPFTPPADHGTALSPPVLKVIERALAKEPAARFASAGSLARALRGAFEGREEVTTRDLSDLLPEPAPASPPRWRAPVWTAAILAALVAAASGWGLAQMGHEPAAADLAVPPHRVAASPDELVREAAARLAAGDALAAQRLARLARRLAPHRAELADLEARATRHAEAQRAELWRDGTVERLLVEAQQLRSSRRYSRALDSLRRAAELDPEQPAVRELIRQVEAAQTRYVDSQAAEQPPLAVEPTFVPRPPAAAPEPAAPLPGWSDLRVDLYSRAPRGVLTLYAGGEQILLEPFRFGKRGGLLRRASGAGRLEARRQLPAGDTELMVYVTLPGRPAVSWPLTVALPAGASRVLRILVGETGDLRVELD